MTSHTDDDDLPLCPFHMECRMWYRIVLDIAAGRLKVTFDEQGRPIIPVREEERD